MHHHFLTYLSPESPHQKLTQLSKRETPLIAPYAFVTHADPATNQPAPFLAIGVPSTHYRCPHEECKSTTTTMTLRSPHCGVAHECERLFPHLSYPDFSAGYICLQHNKIVTNERSGHFGHQWTLERRHALEALLKSRGISHVHIVE